MLLKSKFKRNLKTLKKLLEADMVNIDAKI